MIQDLQDRGITLQRIAEETGLASKGHVHDLKNGKQSTRTFDAAVKLVALHKRMFRRKPRLKKEKT